MRSGDTQLPGSIKDRISNTKKSLSSPQFNPLKPNDHYSGHNIPLTSKRCILYIYSTNIGTEYFKHGIYSSFFFLQNAVCFKILTYLVPKNNMNVTYINIYIYIYIYTYNAVQAELQEYNMPNTSVQHLACRLENKIIPVQNLEGDTYRQ